jgi:hypothetical protein
MALTLVDQAITTAISGTAGQSAVQEGLGRLQGATFVARFTAGGGGATCKAYVQTSLDGVIWADTVAFAFTTATETRYASIQGAAVAPAAIATGGLADNTAAQGLIGDRWRVQLVTTGTYNAGTAVAITMQAR